jgi:hypothetical protein
MSITGPVPAETSLDAVDKLFTSKTKRQRNSSEDVIYTLASAVERLDDHLSPKQMDHAHNAEQKAALIKALTRGNDAPSDPTSKTLHLDGPPQTINLQGGNVKLVVQMDPRRFRPFNVPPVPQPISDSQIDAAEARVAEAERQEEMQSKVLELEIEQQDYSDPYIQQVVINEPPNSENMQHDGFFTSHPAPDMEIEAPYANSIEPEIVPSRRNGLTGRRRVPQPGKARETMYAISVKRQRRLKMKKHKYKKLMRKTRNIRRKLGQI